MEITPFRPEKEAKKAPKGKKEDALVVLTVRVAPKVREELRRFFRRDSDLKYSSISHVVQTAIAEFLKRHS